MAIASYHLTTAGDETDASSYTTASIAPTGNRLVLLAVYSRASVTAGTPATAATATGNGITWVQVANQTATSDVRNGITLLRGLVASPSSGTVAIDFAGQTQLRCVWSIAEFDSVDTTGTNGSGAIVQNAKYDSNNDTTLLATLAAFGSANNATYGAFSMSDLQTYTAGTGFAILGQAGGTSFGSACSEFKNSNDTTVDCTVPLAGSHQEGIAVEIKFATTSSSVNVSDSATIAESTTPQLVNTASVFDSITIAESTTPQVVVMPQVNDSITIAESTTPQLVNTASVVDNATVSEAVTIMEANFVASVVDNATIAETTTPQLVNTASVVDNSTVAENVTIIEANFVASVVDNATIAESTTPQKVNTASVFDSATIAENITAISPSGNANVFDSITISESTTPQLVNTISVVDNINVSESDVLMEVEDAFPVDNITISESVTPQKVNTISVFDSIIVSESTIPQKVNTASVFDSVTIAESITSSPVLQPQVNDSITVSEFYGIFQSLFAFTENWTKQTENSTNWEEQE